MSDDGFPETPQGELIRQRWGNSDLQWGSTQYVPGGTQSTLCRVDISQSGVRPQSLHVHVDCDANAVVEIQYGSGAARHVLLMGAALIHRAVVCGDFCEVRVTPNGILPVRCTGSVALAYCPTAP